MKRAFLVVAVMVLCPVWNGRAWGGEDASVSAKTNNSDLAARYGELLGAKYREWLRPVVASVKEQGYVSARDHSALRTNIGGLIKDKVLGLTAAQRQELVKNTVGEDDYSALVQILTKQLASSDSARQESALRTLGYPLFALGAAVQIKAFVFHSDRAIQYLAVRSLVYLDAAGANQLLIDMIGSHGLIDGDLSEAIHALYISNDKDLDRLAIAVLDMNPDGGTFRQLLPVLRKRSDYRQIVGDVFKNNRFLVPDKKELTLEELASANAESALLQEIFAAPASFMRDEAIKNKVLKDAATRQQFDLYTMALLILEKSGQELSYFVDMQKDNQLPAEKKHVLEKIVSRIQKGERLK